MTKIPKTTHRFMAFVSDGNIRKDIYYGTSESEAIKHCGTALATMKLFGVAGTVKVVNTDHKNCCCPTCMKSVHDITWIETLKPIECVHCE